MIFTESAPPEWTDESRKHFDQGMRQLARMIAADIIKKRAAKAKNGPDAPANGPSTQNSAKS